MRTWILILPLLLVGCTAIEKVQIAQDAKKDSILHTEIANKENAVHVEKDAAHVEKGAIQVDKGLEVNMEPKAINIPITLTPKTNIARGAATLIVQNGALQAPLSFSMAKDAVNFVAPEGMIKVNLTLTVAEGAVVVRGMEKGAIETKIIAPWWATLVAIVAGISTLFYIITKIRKNKTLNNREIGKKGFWDKLF